MTTESTLLDMAFAQSEQTALNEQQLELARQRREQVLTIMAIYNTAKAHVLADGDLSPKGQESRIAQLREEAEHKLQALETEAIRNSLDKRIADEEYQLRPQDPDSDPVLEFLKQQEVRQALQSVDPLTIMEQYLAYATDGSNDLFMRAVENAPMPILQPDVVTKGRQARAERQAPERKQLLAQLKQMRSNLAATISAARTELGLSDLTITKIAEGADMGDT